MANQDFFRRNTGDNRTAQIATQTMEKRPRKNNGKTEVPQSRRNNLKIQLKMRKIMMVAVLAIAIFATFNAIGQSVGNTFSVSGVTYKITSLSPNEVQLGSGNYNTDAFTTNPTGSYTILDSIIGGTNNLTYYVTSIGNYAFFICSGLTSVTIPNSVTSIGQSAFYSCSGLTSVTIPNSVTSIGQSAFRDCSILTSATIGNSVTSIGESAFRDCSGLTGTLNIPNSVTSIGIAAFSNCSGLTSLTIGHSVMSIGTSAFWGCSGLTSVTIGNSVTSIDTAAFYGCSGLTSVTIPNSVTSIGIETFCGCSGLTSVTIGNSVTSIGGGAFFGCSGIDTIVSNATTPPTISSNTFYQVSTNIPVIIPCGTYTAYHSAPYWSNFTNFISNGNVDTTSYNASICNRPTDTYTDANFTTPLHNPGTYYAYLTNADGCDSVICLHLSFYPQVPVTNYSKTICRNASYTDDNFTNPLVNEGIYEATLQNVNGCDSVVRLTLSMIDPPAQELCMVSVDENNHNEVVWKRDDYTGDTNSNDNISNVVSYVIYKEGNVNGQYDVAATIPYDSLNHWVDTASNAKIRSYRYKVSAIDTCGNESVLSEPHKTMHLTINAGQNNSWNLIWDAYEGMSYQTYNIYRGTSMDTMELINTIPSSNTSYSDFSAPTNGYVYYVVEIMLDNPCTISKSLTSIRSNIATNNPNAVALNNIETANLSIYPNPAHKEINITCGEKINSIEVVDLLGKVVYQGKETTIDVSAFAKGNYFVRVQTDKGTITKKVVVE
jgi:hypothetical protein